MAFKEEADNLDASPVALMGDAWAADVSNLSAEIVQAIKSVAAEVEAVDARVTANRLETANADLSNVSPSDLTRNALDNPASLRDGTMVQVLNGKFEPLVRDTLIFPGGPDLYYSWGLICLLYTSPSPRDS